MKQCLYVLTCVLTDNFLLLFMYLGCTTNQWSIPFNYFLQQLVQGYQGPRLCSLDFPQFLPRVLKDQDTVCQESS